MMPNLSHVLPISDDAMRNGIFQYQDAFLSFSLVANVGFFLIHADHDGWHFRFTNNGVEFGARSVFTR